MPATADVVARLEAHQTLTAAVRALPEPERSVVLLRFYEDLSSTEIAARLEEPASTIRWRVRRALGWLREELDSHHSGGRVHWVALMTPLASHIVPPLASDGGATGSLSSTLSPATLTGGLIMKTKLVYVATLAAVALAGLLVHRSHRQHETDVALAATVEENARLMAELDVTEERVERAAVRRSARLAGRVVAKDEDASADPLAGAAVPEPADPSMRAAEAADTRAEVEEPPESPPTEEAEAPPLDPALTALRERLAKLGVVMGEAESLMADLTRLGVRPDAFGAAGADADLPEGAKEKLAALQVATQKMMGELFPLTMQRGRTPEYLDIFAAEADPAVQRAALGVLGAITQNAPIMGSDDRGEEISDSMAGSFQDVQRYSPDVRARMLDMIDVKSDAGSRLTGDVLQLAQTAPHDPLRATAIRKLADVDSPAADQTLEKVARGDGDERFRSAAVRSLAARHAGTGDADVIRTLDDIEAREASEDVRETIRSARSLVDADEDQ